MKMSLYPWQKECIKAWIANQGRGVVKVVTGAGKTHMALAATQELQLKHNSPLKIKIVVPKIFMVAQWASFILDLYGDSNIKRDQIGYYYGAHKGSPNRPYMIYVINSARFALARHILADFEEGYRVLLIGDECHHYASTENRRIFEFIPKLSSGNLQNYFSLGLSATPHTEGFSEILVPALGPLIYTYGFSEAIQHKVINNCVLYNIGLRLSAEEMVEYAELTHAIAKSLAVAKKYTRRNLQEQSQDFFVILKRLANSSDLAASTWAIGLLGLMFKRRAIVYEASVRIECALELIARLDSRARIIVFGERITQCNILFEQLAKSYPNQVARYHSEMGVVSKKRAIAQFRDHEVRILVCCKALDEGFNIPSADVGIVLSSTSTERQRIQRLGRILRSSKSKARSNLYYFYILGSLEESALLPETITEMEEFTVKYYESERSFGHEAYDHVAAQVVRKLTKRDLEEAVVATMRYFLQLGQLRSDWLLDERTLQKRADTASEKIERNYWLAMLSMARENNSI